MRKAKLDKKWIQVGNVRGKPIMFHPLAPKSRAIHLVDIAHALSNLCRYTGHVNNFYCPTPDQRILTDDLRWIPAGDLVIGQGLLAFDEYPWQSGGAGKNRRRFRRAFVTHAQHVKRRLLRVVLSSGQELRCSAEHPWLVATKQSLNQRWQTASQLRQAIERGSPNNGLHPSKRYMNQFIRPWKEDSSREGGWLAGLYDGEGCLSISNRGGVQCGVAQNPGSTLTEIDRCLHARGFDFGDTRTGGAKSQVHSLQIRGGWREIARLLGSVRPLRLLEKFRTSLSGGDFDKQLDGSGDPLEIVRVIDDGTGWCAGLETSTHTYICEGFGAHNSVAEHCVRVSWRAEEICSNEGGDPEECMGVARQGLFHDAAEAYLGDVATPVKHQEAFAAYRAAEDHLLRKILRKFKLPETLFHEIKQADTDLLWTEVRDLMKPVHR